MCGILGIFSINRNPISDQLIENGRKSSQAMSHRGPDDSGEYISTVRNVALFHRRLSIIDLSNAGHQPMTNENRQLWIVFNGEIYNYKTLKAELEKKGHRFISNSDTEAILHGYEEYGTNILEKLRGIFAFGLYDQEKHQLFVARDRLGVKPLYYSFFDCSFLFSSSLHALIRVVNKKPDLDKQNIYEYLYLGMVQAPNTILKGYFKLSPGQFALIEADKNEINPVQYWEVDHNPHIQIPEDENQLIEQLDFLITDAVKSRLIADVPISVFLSGGLDSGLIASIACKNCAGQIKSFSLGFKDNPQLNELKKARETAKWLGTDHHEILIGQEDIQAFFPEFVKYQEEPNLNPIQMMIYFLSRLAHQTGTKVVLSGDGGDELFFGYNEWLRYLKFYETYYAKLAATPAWFRKALYQSSKSFLPVKPRFDILRRLAANETFYYGWGGFKLNELQEILHADFLYSVQSPYQTINELHERYDSLVINDECSYSNWMRYVSLKTYLVEDYLSRIDNQGMANSIEGRVPLLDQYLVEFAFQLSSNYYLKNMDKKYLLKKVAEKYLPKDFIYRPKRGFTAPIIAWLDSRFKGDFIHQLKEFNSMYEIFSSKFIDNVQDFYKSQRINPSAYWSVVNLVSFFSL